MDIDLVLELGDSPARREFIECFFRERWPDLVTHRDPTAPHELFYYKDQTAVEDWADHGDTQENLLTLYYVIYLPHQITVVGDSALAEDLGNALKAWVAAPVLH